jgi:glucose dehydrogenase
VSVIARSAATKQSHRERAKSAWVWTRPRAAVAALLALAFAAGAAAQEWPSYGGDPGGQRFSGAVQITPQNVERLAQAWIFHTGRAASWHRIMAAVAELANTTPPGRSTDRERSAAGTLIEF